MAAHNWLSISLLAPMFHIPPTYMYVQIALCVYTCVCVHAGTHTHVHEVYDVIDKFAWGHIRCPTSEWKDE